MERPCDASPSSTDSVWREVMLWICLAITLLIHGSRLTQHGLRGEEARRGLVAVEMMRTGDWVVPRQQGTLFLSRPPLQNWVIAATGSLIGEVDRLAIRLPSLISLIAMAGLIYIYSRRWLPVGSSTLASLSFVTMGQVLELGNLGETESMYTLTVAGSMLLWHQLWVSGRHEAVAWSIGYGLAAAGMLAKGLQAPVYFVAAVGAYLIVKRQWRSLFSRAHLFGIVVFLVLWNSWNIPFLISEGWANTLQMYRNDISMRFDDQTWWHTGKHVLVFPIEVLVCMLPWSFLLPLAVVPKFWRNLSQSRDPAIFMVVALAVTFPSVWFTPGAHARYFMPLYPCAAILSAIAVEQIISTCRSKQNTGDAILNPWLPSAFFTGGWQRFLSGFAFFVMAFAIAVAAMGLTGQMPETIDGTVQGLLLAFVLGSIAVLLFRFARDPSATHQTYAVISCTLAIAAIYLGVFTKRTLADTNDARPDVANIKSVVPSDRKLVSYGLVDHLFALHYESPIDPVDMQDIEALSQDGEVYCCFNANYEPSLPDGYEYESLALINCKRSTQSNATRLVRVVKLYRTAPIESERLAERPDEDRPGLIR